MMNENNKGLRGLGGTKMVIDIEYADLVIACKLSIDDVTDDNGCEFETNLSLFLEGLGEDLTELNDGREVRFIPVRPKEQQDVE